MKKGFIFGAAVSALCLVTADANATQTCPAGCFCVDGGKFIPQDGMQPGWYENVCLSVHESTPKPLPINMVGCGDHTGSPQVLIAKNHNQPANYYFDEFSEFYGGAGFDFYGFRNGKFTTCPLDGRNISNCPAAYPYSDPGASKLTQCFKLENGVKKYFKIKLNSAPAAPATKKHSARSATMPKKVVVKEIIFDESNSIIDEAFNDFEDFEGIDNLEI